MIRLSPFPKDAERPLRDVAVLAAHGIEEHLRSWAFWMILLAMPAILLLSTALTASTVSLPSEADFQPLWIVAEEPIATTLEAMNPEKTAFEVGPVPPEGRSVLTLVGTDVAGLQATLMVPDGTGGGWPTRVAEGVLGELRAMSSLTEAERARLRPATVIAERDGAADLVAQVDTTMPMWMGILALLGWVGGLGATSRLVKERDSEYFFVLRLTTPASVLYVGGLLERLFVTVLIYGVVLILPLLAVLLMGALALTAQPERAPWYLVVLPLLLGLAIASAYLVASGVGALMGLLSRGGGSIRMRALAPLALLAVLPIVAWLASLDMSAPSPWQWMPVVGLPLALKGVGEGLQTGWLGLSALSQVGWGLGALRFGTWAYSVEDDPLDELRRLWRRP